MNSLIKTRTSYTEKHHIVPKSFAKDLSILNINDPNNIVSLTAKEHYVCHLLLARMFNGKFKRKMSYAIHRLSYSNNGNKQEVYVSSRHYELLKRQHSLNLMGEGNPMFGKLHNEYTKKKISQAASKRIVSKETRLKMSESHKGSNNSMYGQTHTEDSRKKISDKSKGRDGDKNSFYGKSHSIETKEKLSKIKKSLPKSTCQHCNKMIDPSNYKRWHGDNCKFKPV
jgi:hypothetical protein